MLSSPYDLFLVMVAKFYYGSKIKTVILYIVRDKQSNNHAKFYPNPFSSFRKIINDNNGRKVMPTAHFAYGQVS